MLIKVGQKVRVLKTERGHKSPNGQARTEKVGVIEKITPLVITIKTTNYRVSFNIAEIISPYEYYLAVWTGSEWVKVTVPLGTKDFKQIGMC